MKDTVTRIWTSIKAWWGRQSRRRKIVYGVLVAIILLIVLKNGNDTTGTTIETVKRQNLVRSVAASGTVVSSTDLSLGFEQSKMVSSIRVWVGAPVKKGDILANLSNGTERAAVSSARGSLLAAQARYKKVVEGSSNEQVKLAQVQLENARRTLLSEDLIAKPEDANDTATAAITPTISGTYTGTEGTYRLELDTIAQNLVRYSGLERGSFRASDLVPQPLGTKGLFVKFPSGSIEQLSNAVWTITIPNIEGSAYIANKSSLDEKQAQLDLTRASAREADVDAALADVVVAQAGVDTAVAALEKTILRAPADGTITAVDIKIGEIAEVGKRAVALQDVSNLYLEANINESDIKSVALDQPVTVTFDAFPGDTYQATVSSVDPAATIDDNVVNYKIKALLADIQTIKPGMTANLTIKTAEVPNVLVLPARTITIIDGKSTVQLVTDERRKKTVVHQIETGLKGDGNLVEIVSGINEGDRVLWMSN